MRVRFVSRSCATAHSRLTADKPAQDRPRSSRTSSPPDTSQGSLRTALRTTGTGARAGRRCRSTSRTEARPRSYRRRRTLRRSRASWKPAAWSLAVCPHRAAVCPHRAAICPPRAAGCPHRTAPRHRAAPRHRGPALGPAQAVAAPSPTPQAVTTTTYRQRAGSTRRASTPRWCRIECRSTQARVRSNHVPHLR